MIITKMVAMITIFIIKTVMMRTIVIIVMIITIAAIRTIIIITIIIRSWRKEVL